MLIRFKVGNYLSFNEVQELSMISGDTRNHPDHICVFGDINVLRISAVYGANASGKSNLIKAIKESKRMITTGRPIRSDRYFRPSAANRDEPSFFEFEFEKDGKYFSYGFEFLLSAQRIESEWLYGLSTNGENRIFFQRNGNKIDHNFKGDDKVRMDVYAEDMENSDSTLFLKEMYKRVRADEKELSVFFDVYRWFSQKMMILGNESHPYELEVPENEEDIARLLEAFGTGITDIGYEQIDMHRSEELRYLKEIREDLLREKKRSPGSKLRISFKEGEFFSLSDENELMLHKLVFRHGNSVSSFDMEEESEGTQRLYDLLSMVISKEEDCIYILDELDLKLHPQLTFRFVEFFLKNNTGTKNQLIFTTHESNLMDFKLLRRDEIWFVEKGKDESSALFSLEDFNERTDRKIDKTYLEGRYGGVPVFSALFPISGGDTDETPRE